MATLKELLPPAKSSSTTYYDHTNDPWFKQRFSSSEEEKSAAVAAKQKPTPPYLKRAGFVPRRIEDFGDGGAFPEIHVAQYPLDMGRNKASKPGSKILPVTVDAHGNVAYDAIVRQNENARKIVYTQQKDLIPKILKNDEEDDAVSDDEAQKQIEETMQETKAALEKIVNVRLSAAQPKNVPKQNSDAKYIKYKPSQQSAAFNSGAKERVIRMVEMPVDPLEPPKFKHKRVPKASGSPPVPVMHSPPRPVTVKDQQDWKIPPCISNWKNPKGYTIPLDKRLAADGRGLQDVQINDNFAKLSESLYVAEQKAREAVAMRSKVQKEMMLKEKERKEQELRALAQKARSERIGGERIGVGCGSPSGGRLEAKDAAMGKRSKITRDRDRDISEKVALGMASTKTGTEVMYDERLFSQDKGMASGFATDDQYNVYENGLFTAQPTLSTLYRPKKDLDNDTYGGFSGASERAGPRDRPVEFENEEADPFGLDQFLTEVKKGKKAMEKVGGGGTMRASAGSSMRDGYEGGSGRTRIGFERGH
uniref:SNW domain-containing protein 1 n=1 Tax=Cajanus cajan TaxID=3821 RepID=A0A151R3N8_CAJCA|nr:SNW domain-containing protein 1 [Cajanus cajan]